MNAKLQMLVSLAALFLLSSCAELTHYTKSKSLDSKPPPGSKAILVDAKQRAIISSTQEVTTDVVLTTYAKDDTGRDTKEQTTVTDAYTRICAEPSPDALSALAATSSLTASKKDRFSLEQALAISEGAGSIGLRTQSIQLMRDAMYRYCEMYLSGQLNEITLETLHRRLQSSMIAILAIEQLTGVVKPPPVTIGGSAIIGSAELVAKYTEMAKSARSELETAKKAETEKKSTLDEKTKALTKLEGEEAAKKKELDEAKKNNTGDIPKLTSELEALQAKVKTAKEEKEKADSAAKLASQAQQEKAEEVESYEAARKAALSGAGKSGTTVNIGNSGAGGLTTAKDVQAIATAVEKITQTALNLNFSRELCPSILANYVAGGTGVDKQVYEKCVAYMESTIDFVNATTANVKTCEEINKATATVIEKSNAEQAEKLLGALKDYSSASCGAGVSSGNSILMAE